MTELPAVSPILTVARAATRWIIGRISGWLSFTLMAFRSGSSLMEQKWLSLMPQVGHPYLVRHGPCRWRLVIDLGYFDPSDRITIIITAQILGPNPDQITWMQTDAYQIQLISNPDGLYLAVNGAIMGKTKLAILESTDGPWMTRIHYTQDQGLSKPVRFLILPKP